jgi:7-cyano-7-deazaguanine tRNA-ribosyltransferase
MSFEIKEKDLLGRIGKLKTKTGILETPLLFPVVNPSTQIVPPERLKEEFGFEAVITNAYILKKRFQDKPAAEGIHNFLKFDGSIMTDSGAYQILVYGNVDVSQEEIVEYQEKIGSDIATILDVPTGWRINKEEAEKTVSDTLTRAKAFFKTRNREDILWVGPIQGGRHIELVKKSALAMRKLPFHIHALGSPTEVMESYRYDVLVDMIAAAKRNLPSDRPLHLFGAGHPAMFALVVALGCDLFDSAAYALYAREGRYMTENGTWRINELEYLPCECPKCAKTSLKTVLEMELNEKERFLAEHNLYVCVAELKRIKQAIRDGRLWEHVETRAHSHPELLTALKRLKKYEEIMEMHSPAVKGSGLFFYNSTGLARPEVVRFRNRLTIRYKPQREADILLLCPQTKKKPFHKAQEFSKIRQVLQHSDEKLSKRVHVCFYAAPFGLIPLELDEVYPLSQHETTQPLDQETCEYVARQVGDYIARTHYSTVILINDHTRWSNLVKEACKKICRKRGITFESAETKDEKSLLIELETLLKNISGKNHD